MTPSRRSSDPAGSLRVPAEHDGSRLDRFLAAALPEVSRTRIQGWIVEGGVKVDGRPSPRASTALRAGALVEVEARDAPPPPRAEPAPGTLRTVFADANLLVVDKPAGMLAHATSARRGPSVSELADREHGPLPSAQGRHRPGIVHRLDAGTSGLLVLARTAEAAQSLVEQFRRRTVLKTYTAIVHGEPRFDSDWIEAAIDRNPKAPQKRRIVPDGEGRPAATFYTVRERLRGFAVLACQPKTGRTHQIRVHLAHIDLPIVGDRTYKHHGPLKVPLPKAAPPLARQALHASRLEFDHPSGGERVAFESPLPPDMAELLAWLRAHHAR